MKIAILICEMTDGSVELLHANSVLPMLEKAREIRAIGQLNKKSVRQGMVMCSWKPLTQKFRCETVEQKKARTSEKK